MNMPVQASRTRLSPLRRGNAVGLGAMVVRFHRWLCGRLVLVRELGCEPGARGFDFRRPPQQQCCEVGK
jgi:hypothetical protein